MGTRTAKYLIFLAGLLTASFAWCEPYRYSDLACGLADTIPGNLIKDCEVTQIQNLRIDPFSRGLIQRKGSSRLNSTQLTGKIAVDVHAYLQDDGDEFLVAKSSNSIYYSSDNGSTWTTIVTTATSTTLLESVNFRDKIYFVDQSDGGYSFDGSLWVAVSSMPAGKYIQKYQNRLFVANTSANNNRLFFSGLLLPSSYTITTDYFDFPEPITAIGKPLDGGLPIYTMNQTWMLRGTSPSNYYVQQISNVIGCAHNRTIQNFNIGENEIQIFLSKGINQTENNLYALNGVSVTPLGNRILTTLSSISIGNSSLRSEVWDTYEDFSNGITTNTVYSFVSGSVLIATNNVNVDNYSFENGSGDVADDWSGFATGVGRRSTSFAHGVGSYSAYVDALGLCNSGNFYIDILDSNDSVLETFTYSYNAFTQDSWTESTGNSLSSYQGQKIKFKLRSSGYPQYLVSDPFYASGVSFGFWGYKDFVSSSGAGDKCDIYIDEITGGVSTISSGTYQSEVVQADASMSQWGIFHVEQNESDGSIDYSIRYASTSAQVQTATYQSISPESQIPAGTNRFIQWKAEMNGNSSLDLYDIRINKVVANWVTGNTNAQPLASVVFNGDYWLSYTGPMDSRNKSILYMNREGAFAGPTTGLNAYSLAVQRARLFAGDSSTDTVNGGYVWEYETGTTDNGTAVTSQVTFKNQEFENLENYDKTLDSVLFSYAVDQGTFTASIIENFNEYQSDYTVYFSSGTNYNRFNPNLREDITGRNFALQFTNSYPGTRLKLYPPIDFLIEKQEMIPQ